MLLYRDELLQQVPVLQLNPAIDGVFGGAYPFGIDPVRTLPGSVIIAFLPSLWRMERVTREGAWITGTEWKE